MNWYDRLNHYFPNEEMKDKEHLMDLIADKDIYHKEETKDYIVLYAEFPDFIFIDYLLVLSTERGKGIGTRLLNRFKEKGKLILLEAEPPNTKDVDTHRRLAFYQRNGFKEAHHIEYERQDDEGNDYVLNILYWTAEDVPQEIIMERMKEACRVVHNDRSRYYYGREIANPEEVLHWIE
ncbi:GNAT family N-acetyltransferase [Paenibacillus sp. HB172176]|uniref:GNAT family N-acetyltransferase n=1 Tax=Paenibacillus sp. HB172176 TaxID=2493690 RepID=UPI001439C23C|nr:GNAT family N-acetyltransferase [Paenibacillus sp. HB172176]